MQLLGNLQPGATGWEELLRRSITSAGELGRWLSVDEAAVDAACRRYPMNINPYFLELIRRGPRALWLQAVPQKEELADRLGTDDPLAEEHHSPMQHLVHRYPDRVLWLAADRCALHCRFCTRKRRTGRFFSRNRRQEEEIIAYIRSRPQVRDVILSGGDPLLLADDHLEYLLANLRRIPHVEIIRLGTRVPCVLPQRVTPELCRLLARFQPLYVLTHFNHPAELTPEALHACALLADAGLVLGCQTVLLRGVNDTPETMLDLMQRLVAARVRPYYLHQLDLARGTAHFFVEIRRGLEIMEFLRRHTSGLCVPHYVVDLPGTGGKVELCRSHIQGERHGMLLIRGHDGNLYRYPATSSAPIPPEQEK